MRKDNSLRGKIGDKTIIQTRTGESVYVFDEDSGAVLLHASLSAPFPTVDALQAAFVDSVRKAEEKIEENKKAGKYKTYKITITMKDGTETEKTYEGLVPWRFALVTLQEDGVQAVRMEKKA